MQDEAVPPNLMEAVRTPTPKTVGFFGSFYPRFQRSANSSTGMVLGLAGSAYVEEIYAFVPEGSVTPEFSDQEKIRRLNVWSHDDPVSLIRATLRMAEKRRSIDVYLFNMYVTSFGRSKLSNAVGLSIPLAVRLLSHRRVVVYMHNFVETEDYRVLGYQPSRFQLMAARLLETLLIRGTKVVVPLRSQKLTMDKATGGNVGVAFLPYVESFLSLLRAVHDGRDPPKYPQSESLRFLLFGSWGPGKDLEGILQAFGRLRRAGLRFRVTLAGSVNDNFPEYRKRFGELIDRYRSLDLDVRQDIAEDEVLSLFNEHDVLVLPYRATGGYSGAMNAAAPSGIPMVAYDLPQLRESALILSVVPRFVACEDPNALVAILNEAACDGGIRHRIPRDPLESMAETQRALTRLVSEF